LARQELLDKLDLLDLMEDLAAQVPLEVLDFRVYLEQLELLGQLDRWG
jgi:hypothetical protein